MSAGQAWWRRHNDALVPVVLLVGFPVELLNYRPADLVLALPLTWAVALVLLARRKAALAMFATIMVLNVGIDYAAPDYHHHSVCYVLAFVYSLYSLGAYATGPAAWWCGVPLVLACAVFGALSDHDVDPAGIVFFVLFSGLPWGAGVAVRLRQEREATLNLSNAELREQTERAVAAERARIARELHDVVSHAIAVTVLQARGAGRVVDRDDAAVLTALEAIEQTNTAALADMRRMLALLREADEGPRSEPAPSLDRLDALLEHVRSSGLPVDLATTGDRLPVPPGLDLSAYRIVQEALTNVLKHGGPDARATVQIGYAADELLVEVTNRGAPPPADTGGGHGLIGIRERVAVGGGSVEAGPVPGGFAVRARLPYLTDLATQR